MYWRWCIPFSSYNKAYRSLDSCQNATSTLADVAFSSSLTAAPVKSILSRERRCEKTTETARHIYQKALKSSRKPRVGTEDQEDHFCHTAVQTSNTQELLQRSHALLQTPHTATQDGEVGSVGFGAISHLQHPQGLTLAHLSRRSKIYSGHITKPLHPPGWSPCHLHRSFPSHRWAGRGCEEDYLPIETSPNSPAQGSTNNKLVMVAKDPARLETCQPC